MVNDLRVPPLFSLLELHEGESFGAFASESLSAYPGAIEGVLQEWKKAAQAPLLPHGLKAAVSPFKEGLPAPVKIAQEHTELRYRILSLTEPRACLLARDVIDGDNTLYGWRIGGSHADASRSLLPAACLDCLELQLKSGRTYYRVMDSIPGYDVCSRHEKVMFQCCDACAKSPGAHHFDQAPHMKCRCGGKRVPRRLRTAKNIALGMSEDIELLLGGALDCHPYHEVREQMQRRATELGLYGLHDAKRVAEFLGDNHVQIQLNRLGAFFSAEPIGHVLQGRTLHQNPGVNLVCIRALFGSLAELVGALELDAEKAKFTAQKGAYYVDVAPPGEARLDAMRQVLAYVADRRDFVRQADFVKGLQEEFAYFILHREQWALSQVKENWESNGKAFAAMDVSDQGKADKLRQRLDALKNDSFHPQRTKTMLLRGIMNRGSFNAHSNELPALSKLLIEACEEPVDFHRRIYLGMVSKYPERLHPRMPRAAEYIARLPNERLRILLTELDVKIVNGHVKSI